VDERPDLTAADRGPVLRFGPDRRLTALEGGGALVVLLAAIPTSDPAGRLLLIGAALILGAYAVTDLVFNPRLTASGAGLVLHSPFARARLAWTEIDSISADTRHRLGLRSTALEIDAGAVLAQFTRRGLGRDPAAAAALLQALDPRPPSERRGAEHDRRDDEHGDRA
jgi:hypothetical protein